MGCCCGLKRDNSTQLEEQVKGLVDKCARVANNQRHFEEENLRLRNMQLHLDDCYYVLDCEVQNLHSDVQMALPQPSIRLG